jgi:hypothetical protein
VINKPVFQIEMEQIFWHSVNPRLLPFGRWGVYISASLLYNEHEPSGGKMTTEARHHTPWYLWPFAAVWKLVAIIVEMTGRLLAMILGIVFMLVGVLVSLTIVGAIIGIPLSIVGFLLFIRGIF